MKHTKKITIIGAGPVGLASAYYAHKKGLNFEIFEASNAYGGNCKTFEVDGFRFDSGAHRLHDKIDEITEDWKVILGDSILSIEKPSKIIDQKREFDFPLSPLNLLKNLSAKEIFIAGIQFLTYRKKNESFSEQARYNYTPILANKFLLNYSQKLWGVSPDELLPEVSGGRLKGLNFNTIIKEFFNGQNKKTEHLDGRFYYPEKGIQEIFDEIIKKIDSKITFNSSLQQVFIDNNKIASIQINEENHPVDFIINSAPVHLFFDADESLKIQKKTEFRHLILMTINLDRKPIGDIATYYFPDDRYRFTRVVEPRVRSEKMAPQGKTSLMIEIPVSDFTFTNRDELKKEILFQLEEAQFFKQNEVINVSFFNLKNAYPVLSQSNKENSDIVMNKLNKIENLKTFGRMGGYSYVHLHDIFKFAKDLIDDYAENH